MWTSRCRVTGKPRSSPNWSKKGKRGWKAQIDKILALYARGMTTRDIQAQLQEFYGVEISPTLISNVTEAVMDEVRQWQSRPLEPVYPIMYVDCLVVNVRENQRVINKALAPFASSQLEWREGTAGYVAGANGRRQVLALCPDRVAEPRRQGHLHCLRGWAGRLARSH